jgi:hypothetical protein
MLIMPTYAHSTINCRGSQYLHDHPCKLEGRISVRDFGFADCRPSVLSPKHEVFCCDQNGPPARRSEPDWRMEGAYLNRYVTDEQRSRRPIFITTRWAGASWLFFRVARSTRMTQI